jgi:hypothetical protein
MSSTHIRRSAADAALGINFTYEYMRIVTLTYLGRVAICIRNKCHRFSRARNSRYELEVTQWQSVRD